MPFHRRSFLAAASASIALPLCNVFAEDTALPELKFLVITDTHLGYVVTTGRSGRVSAYHK